MKKLQAYSQMAQDNFRLTAEIEKLHQELRKSEDGLRQRASSSGKSSSNSCDSTEQILVQKDLLSRLQESQVQQIAIICLLFGFLFGYLFF